MKNPCSQCGFPYDPAEEALCPKCQAGVDQLGWLSVLEIDVVHAGETWVLAKDKIVRGLDQAIFHRHKGLKIIHGYGSLSGSSVIAPQAIAYMRHLAEAHDARFSKDSNNPGASIIWLNRQRTNNSQQPEWKQPHLSKGDALGGNWFDQAMKKK